MKKYITILAVSAVLLGSCNSAKKDEESNVKFIEKINAVQMEMLNKSSIVFNKLTPESTEEENLVAMDAAYEIQKEYYQKIIDLKGPKSFKEEEKLDKAYAEVIRLNEKTKDFFTTITGQEISQDMQKDLDELSRVNNEIFTILDKYQK